MVAIKYKVGSNVEKNGYTGFTHLFEHMMFQGSKHFEKGEYDQYMQKMGATYNAYTSNDITCYYSIVPFKFLENILWLESERMGYFIENIKEENLKNQIKVVLKEKTQRRNVPYRKTSIIANQEYYKPDHRYYHEVIGTREDIKDSKIKDLKNFYNKYYQPKNAVLTIAGDIDEEKTIEYVQKYFSAFTSDETVYEEIPKPSTKLKETKRITVKEEMIKLPKSFFWIPIEGYIREKSQEAFDRKMNMRFLSMLISQDIESVFYKELIETKIAQSAHSSFYCAQLDCMLYVAVTFNENKKLNLKEMSEKIHNILNDFDRLNITEERIKNLRNAINFDKEKENEKVLRKASKYSHIATLYGEIDDFEKKTDIAINKISVQSIKKAHLKHVKNQNYLLSHAIPSESEIKHNGVITDYKKNINKKTEKPAYHPERKNKPENFDRTLEPLVKEDDLKPIQKETSKLGNIVFHNHENKNSKIAIININLFRTKSVDKIDSSGVIDLLNLTLFKETKNQTKQEIDLRLKKLSSSIELSVHEFRTKIVIESLEENLDETINILYELLLENKFSQKELDIAKNQIKGRMRAASENPNSLALKYLNQTLFTKENKYGKSGPESIESVQNTTIQDLNKYYNETTKTGEMHIVSYTSKRVNLKKKLAFLNDWLNYKKREKPVKNKILNKNTNKNVIYYLKTKQKEKAIIAIEGVDDNKELNNTHYTRKLVNYDLGGYIHSRLTGNLREDKGYTYGIRSYYNNDLIETTHAIKSEVENKNIIESIKIIREVIDSYKDKKISKKDLEMIKSSYLNREYGSHVNPWSRLISIEEKIVLNISEDRDNEIKNHIKNLSLSEINRQSVKMLDSSKMIILVAGNEELLEILEKNYKGKIIKVQKYDIEDGKPLEDK